MEHRPFETWLLNDERLTPEQDRELRLHLRECNQCARIARSNLALRAAPVIAPANGFALRFQARLEAQRKVQRRRAIFGVILLALSGIGLLAWFALPYLPLLAISPADLFSTWLGMLLYLSSGTKAAGIITSTMIGALLSIVPGYIWVLCSLIFTGLTALWVMSFRKFSPVEKPGSLAEGVKA